MATEMRFPVEIDDSQAAKELNKLMGKIGKLKDSIAKTEAARTPIANQLKEAQTEAEKARERVEDLKSALAESEYKTSPGGVTDPDTFNAELEKQTQIKSELAQQEKIMQAKETAAKKLQTQDSKLQTTLEQQTAELERQSAEAQELAEKLSGVSTRSNLKEKLAAAVSSLKGGTKSLFSKGGEIDGAVKGIGDSFGNSLKRILAFGIGIRSLSALFNKLRKYITDSIQTFAQYDTETQTSINNLKSALQGLKLQWGAAFAPILNAVAPVLQTLISWLNTAAQAVAQFMATLTGKGTFKKAIANTGKLSSNLGGAADNAKEAKKQLMGIDTLNVMNDTDTGGSGGGGGGGAADGSFEDVTVDAESLPAKIAAALKSGEWAQAATLLTGKLNEMVSSVDWTGIGAKLGYYLDGALTFLATALTTFDWAALAGSLAILFSNLISNVDWANLGVLFTAKFRILLLGIVGFLLNFDWGAAATGLSQFAIGFMNGISDAIGQVDWAAVGIAIWTGFVDIMQGIDWNGVGEAAINLLGAALEAAAALLGAVIGGIWETIVNFFGEFDDDSAIEVVEGFLVGIIGALADIGDWIKEHVFEPFIKGFKAAFGIHSPSTVMREQGGYVMDGLKDGVSGRISSVISKFSDLKNQIVSKLRELIPIASNIDWTSIGTSVVNGIIDGLNRGWQWLVNAVQTICGGLLRTAKNILGIHSPSKVFRDQIGENIGAGIEEGLDNSEGGILQSIRGISSDMLSSFSNVPSSLTSRFASMTLPPMPAVAGGFVVPPNAFSSGGYGGISPELESRIDALLDRLNGNNRPIEVRTTVELDKRKVGESIYTYTEERNRGRGK